MRLRLRRGAGGLDRRVDGSATRRVRWIAHAATSPRWSATARGRAPGTRERRCAAPLRACSSEVVAGATVLPVRFGMAMDDDQAVVDDCLAPRQRGSKALLDDLGGRVQLTLKGEYEEDVLLRERRRGPTRDRASCASGCGRCRRPPATTTDQARRDRRRRASSARESGHARASSSRLDAARRGDEPRGGPRSTSALDAALLVERARIDELERASSARREQAERIELALRRARCRRTASPRRPRPRRVAWA